jgi:hypothetical protein
VSNKVQPLALPTTLVPDVDDLEANHEEVRAREAVVEVDH